MKINEINQSRHLDEGVADALGSFASGLIGEPAAASLQGLFTGKGKRHQLAQNLFLKDFMGDAMTSLKNGLSSGVIDPNIKMDGTAGEISEPTTNKPIDADTSSSTIKPAARTRTGPSTAEKTISAARGFRKGISTAQAAKADQRKINDELLASATAAQKKPSFQQTATDRVAIQKARQAGLIKESEFSKLNVIFENIMAEQEEGTKSIGDYMLEWFGLYMQGTNWEEYKPRIVKLCKNIENAYQTKGNWKNAIKVLAQGAYTLSGPGRLPKGAENIVIPQQPRSSSFANDADKLTQAFGQMTKAEQDKFLAKMDAVKKNK